ncbi:hypothetical protein FB566_1510 [Stackebrandtia endophytica]|uniref:Uncharacterized protein n=1 Tax=Stackebrandtia endophytica TaxID=1496996 RepID=A0A543ATR5_9ACTN|nr:hypothetical protein [Stackebrandtia endophytica]TQL75990.1 hypothetical protein FB566_1510 [Stackebrandtia endophytica]
MTDIKHALEAEALSAPGPTGLLERVKRRSRRRRLCQAGVGGFAVAVMLAAVVGWVWPQTGPSPAASRLGTGDVAICFTTTQAPWSVTITEHAGGDTIDSRTEEFTSLSSPIEQPIVGEVHTLTVSIRSGPMESGALTTARPLEFGETAAVVGFIDERPVVMFESSVADFVIEVTAADSDMDIDVLVEFARSITVHTDPSGCAD